MTITKLGISAAASALLVSSVFAGTITTSGTGNVAEEWFTGVTDRNVSIGTTSYNTEISGSGTVNAPTFVYNITGGTVASDPTNYIVVDATDGNRTITTTGSVDGDVIRFSALQDSTVYNNHNYQLRLDGENNTSADFNVTVTKDQVNTLKVCVELWSTSGTEQKIDDACGTPYKLVPQYKVTCENKLNNLINVENSSRTFVSTKHGALLVADGTQGDLMNVLSDVLRFKVTKTAVDYGYDGNLSVMQVIADTNVSGFVTGTHNFADSDAGHAVDVADLGTGSTELNITDAAGTATDFYGLGASETTYTVTLTTDGNTSIPATNFTASFFIEGNTSIVPADPSYSNATDIGSWNEYAYIAQIPGATSTAATKTKFFVTNRGCKPVTPQMRLILDGQVTTVDFPVEIAPNTQAKVLLSDVLSAHNLPDGQYSVEIIIPGNAEDFYVYAQAQSQTDLAATKDLPVYNTSTRSN